jgi:acyl-CoA thioester hydrolase
MIHFAPTQPIHRMTLRVYYEDTDAAGIVYYANYLRFIERGRTELLRTLGHDQNVLMKQNVAFAVRAVSAEYLKPAVLDDLLTIETAVGSLARAQMIFVQRVRRGEEPLFDAQVRIACIDPVRGKPIRIPDAIRKQISTLLAPTQ